MRITLFVLFFGLSPAGIFAQNLLTGDNIIATAEKFRKGAAPDSAIFYYNKAADFFQQSGESQKLVNVYNQLGILYTRQDKYEPAKKFLEAARDLHQDLPLADSLSAATTFISLGVLYAAEKKYDLSLQQHFTSLRIRQAIHGKWHADIATSYGNIGNVYLRKNEPDSAIYYHRRALEVREKLFGEKSIEIIESYNGLGNSFKAKKEFGTALFFYEKALANKILQRGSAHKDLARFYTSISDVYYLLGKDEMGAYYKKLSSESVKD